MPLAKAMYGKLTWQHTLASGSVGLTEKDPV